MGRGEKCPLYVAPGLRYGSGRELERSRVEIIVGKKTNKNKSEGGWAGRMAMDTRELTRNLTLRKKRAKPDEQPPGPGAQQTNF